MEFWHNRWGNQQIGWHRHVYNDLMVKHWPEINAPKGGSVLVPLCGKTLDMLWLAQQGHEVVGLEMVQQAIDAFFAENNLQVNRTEYKEFSQYSSPPFSILQGNVFNLPADVKQCDAWYDRAAMIAINPSNREAYIDLIRNQTKPGAVGLLITLTYPQEQMKGPPFSLTDEDVVSLYSSGFDVELLEKISLEDEKESGLSSITSSVFRINRLNDQTNSINRQK